MLRRALPYVAYPAVIAGALAFGVWAIGRHWPAWAVGVVVFAVAMAVVTGLEWLIPYSAAWSQPRGDRRTDLYHMLLSNRAFDAGSLLAIAAFAPLGGGLARQLGLPLWPHGWPLAAQTLLAILLFELPMYVLHRLEHECAPLWRLHSVHHSCRRLYWWNFARNHPFDNVISALVAYAPVAFLGVGEGALALMTAFSAAHGLLQHSNVDLRTGFLDFFVSTAQVHRWHHAPDRERANCNYSTRVMLWDHVFGTYRFEAGAAPPEDVGLGSGDLGFPESYLGQLSIPFDAAYWRAQKP